MKSKSHVSWGSTPPPSSAVSAPSTITAVDHASATPHKVVFLKQIDKGSSGRVFIATTEPMRGIFAAKILFKEQCKYFLREQSSLICLHHPGIPSLLFSATLPTSYVFSSIQFIFYSLTHAIILKFVSEEMLLATDLGCGGSLLALGLDHQPLTESRARPILRQVFSAVAHAHSRQIVHRDIKLENVIFKDYSQTSIFLIDWGLSTFFSPSSLLQEDCGSLPYASPELLSQKPYIGPEVDAWALGILAYAIVLGNFPFGGSTPQKKLMEFSKPIPFPPSLSPEIVSLILHLLHLDASHRLLPAKAMEHVWFNSSLTPPETLPLSPRCRKIRPSKFCHNLDKLLLLPQEDFNQQ